MPPHDDLHQGLDSQLPPDSLYLNLYTFSQRLNAPGRPFTDTQEQPMFTLSTPSALSATRTLLSFHVLRILYLLQSLVYCTLRPMLPALDSVLLLTSLLPHPRVHLDRCPSPAPAQSCHGRTGSQTPRYESFQGERELLERSRYRRCRVWRSWLRIRPSNFSGPSRR